MASFKALNIESDDELDDEPDDTKEIQIEDALKIYQTALKNHSQGSKTLKEAGEAYTTLFESEIFKYPESQSEFKREEALGRQQIVEGAVLPEIEFVTAAPTSNAENASNALPQILHLSYKNRGQYHLDLLGGKLNAVPGRHEDDNGETSLEISQIRPAASRAIDDFAEALDKDEEDVDLWRRAARVGEILGSKRVARFCLESVLDDDEESLEDIFGVPAIEKTLAREDLKKLAQRIDDTLSLSQIPEPINVPSAWKKQLQLYPLIPEDPDAPAVPHSKQAAQEAATSVLAVTEPTWNGVGQAILQRLRDEQYGLVFAEPGAAVQLRFPDDIRPEKETMKSPLPQATQSPEKSLVPQSANDTPQPISHDQKPLTQEVTTKPLDINEEAATAKSNEASKPTQKTLPDRTSNQDGGSSGQEPDKPVGTSRKRSVEVADMPENPEVGRGRSKRLRARTSVLEELQPAEGKALESMSDYEWKINQSMFADGGLFDVLRDITRRLGINGIKNATELRDVISLRNSMTASPKSTSTTIQLAPAMIDFYGLMQKWNDTAAKILLRSNEAEEVSDTSQKTGLLTFLEQAKSRSAVTVVSDFNLDITDWLRKANETKSGIVELAMFFIQSILEHSNPSAPSQSGKVWSEALKQTLVQMIIDMDCYMMERLSQARYSESHHGTTASIPNFSPEDIGVVEFVQSLFELHLDVYIRITNPASEVDPNTRVLQKHRLDAWCDIAREYMNDHMAMIETNFDSARLNTLVLRHLWTSVFHLTVIDTVEQEHLILCLHDLKREMAQRGNPVISLPNNAIIPELSVSAADREISQLKTTDFFLRVSQTEGKAPVDQIEDLEPLLEEAETEPQAMDETEGPMHNGGFQEVDPSTLHHSPAHSKPNDGGIQHSSQNLLSQFLRGADVSLRLLLWRRLSDAYEAIGYPPKVLSISLKSMQLLVAELKRPGYAQKKTSERERDLLETVRDCGEIVTKALDITENNTNAFECLDDEHIKHSIIALIDWWNLLYAVALFDDYSQAGQKGGSLTNPFRFYPLENFHQASIKLHGMQVQCSILLYQLITEALKQIPENFPNPVDDKLQYLRNVHWFFGVRRLCKASDSQLLRFTKDELLKLPELTRQSSDDLAQVLYDLYELHCFSTPLERLEHGCDVDYLDKPTALQLIDFVMDKVKRSNIKELLKSDLGKTVDKIHNALGGVKNTSAIGTRNRKFFNNYLRSPIRPIDLYRCVNGVGDLSAVPMTSDDGVIASKGWFALKGQLALAKFKSQRSKSGPASEDDLNAAILFFSHDLEYFPDHWESWFRLAQAHDALLEEHVLWSAEKLNNNQTDLCQTQRAAIHAYAIAIAYMFKADITSDQMNTLAELYSDFGIRIYASSSQPFAMKAFSTRDFPERHFSDDAAPGGKYTHRSFKSLKQPGAWKLSGSLLQKAIVYDPQNWVNHYMLAKSIWKIHQKSNSDVGTKTLVMIKKALFTAIETLPVRKDPSRQDPVLEPIYKVVSLAYKLVLRGDLDDASGEELIHTGLVKQKQFEVPKIPQLSDFESWSLYVLDILRLLRAADKSRWHHRVVFRAARIIHGLYGDVAEGARRAKDYLIDQHLYSLKTLALTVWKPENERPGRHFFYMRQYALFMAQIFEETDDLESIETLARRIRKKQNEFYEHTSLWEEVCLLHLKVHRKYGKVPEGICDAVFKNIDQEEFGARASLIDTWTSSPSTNHPLRDVLRETAELKRLNSGLMKLPPLDDLLGDTYAAIWNELGPSLEEQAKQTRPSTPAPITPTPVASPPTDRRSVMSLTNLMNIDGAAEPRSQPTPITLPAATMPSTSLLPMIDMALKPRARLISRREIIKRASDTVIPKMTAPQKASPPPTKPSRRSIDPNIRVVIETRATGATTPDVTKQDEDDQEELPLNSAPGSVHDDADDESELSEEDEDVMEEVGRVVIARPPSMFPNLEAEQQEDSFREDEEDEEGGPEDGDADAGSTKEDSDVMME